jgi:hypothetical protein
MSPAACPGASAAAWFVGRRWGNGDDVLVVDPGDRGRGAVVGDDGDTDAPGAELGPAGEDAGPWRAWIRSGERNPPAPEAERDLPSRRAGSALARRRDTVQVFRRHQLPLARWCAPRKAWNGGRAEVWGGPRSLGALRPPAERIPRMSDPRPAGRTRGAVDRASVSTGRRRGAGRRTRSAARHADRARAGDPPAPAWPRSPWPRGYSEDDAPDLGGRGFRGAGRPARRPTGRRGARWWHAWQECSWSSRAVSWP